MTTLDIDVAADGDDGYIRVDTPGDACSQFNDTISLIFNGRSSASDKFHIWNRFLNVTIPPGSTIDAATFHPDTDSQANDGVGVKTNIYMNDVDNASQPTQCTDIRDAVLTTAFTAWDDQDFSTGEQTSPSIVDVVQEIVNRPGWTSGNAMMIIWRDDVSTDDFFYQCRSFSTVPSAPARLHIEYTQRTGGPEGSGASFGEGEDEGEGFW